MIAAKGKNIFGAADTTANAKIHESGMIRAIVMKVPDFANAVTVTQIDLLDDDGDIYYTNTTGWAKNATHLITSLSVPVGLNYSLKATLSGVPGTGGGTITTKAYIETLK